jgi:hypothetical protein
MKGLASINLFVGAWLIFTAWMMPGGVGASLLTWNDSAIGALLIALSGWTMANEARHPGSLWLQLLAGAWLVVAPFVLRYSPWNDICAGVMVASTAVIALRFETGYVLP